MVVVVVANIVTVTRKKENIEKIDFSFVILFNNIIHKIIQDIVL